MLEGIFIEIINKIKPIKNKVGRGRRAILIQVALARGKNTQSKEISPVPTMAADFPKISYKPKNSPDISAGIIFVK